MDESLQYSVGDGAWTKLTADTKIAFGGQGKDLRLRGQSSTGTAVDSYRNFSTIRFVNEEVPVACTGDIRTLVDYLNYSNASTVDARFCNLFSECIQLTSAPELPATTLAAGCYSGMFRVCKNLKNVTMLATDISAESCLSYWLYEVAKEGTFTKAAEMTSLPSGNGDASIPSGWIVQNYTE